MDIHLRFIVCRQRGKVAVGDILRREHHGIGGQSLRLDGGGPLRVPEQDGKPQTHRQSRGEQSSQPHAYAAVAPCQRAQRPGPRSPLRGKRFPFALPGALRLAAHLRGIARAQNNAHVLPAVEQLPVPGSRYDQPVVRPQAQQRQNLFIIPVRLVHQQDLGIPRGGTGQGAQTSLPSGKPSRGLVRAGRKPQKGHQLIRVFCLAPARLSREKYVLLKRAVRQQQFLTGKAAAPAQLRKPVLPPAGGVRTVEKNGAARGLLQSGKDPQQRGFPACGGPRDQNEPEGGQRQIQPAQYVDGPLSLRIGHPHILALQHDRPAFRL